MNLRGIVAVSGKPGLFKVLGQNKSGFILESLDEQKLKLVANLSTAKLASLEDITVFGEEGDMKLAEIFENMKNGSVAPDPKKGDGNALRTYFREVAPDHDEDRVYASDMKKIITWFNVIKELPLFNEEPAGEETIAEESAPEVEEASAEPIAEKPAKKTKAAKSK